MEDKGISPWRWFFGVPVSERDRGIFPTILWWEFRRPICNILVFAYWIAAVWIIANFDFRTPHPGKSITELPEYTLFTVLGPMIAFNICYTGGWICETVVARFLNSEQHRRFREWSLWFGLAVSLAFPTFLVFLWFYQWKTGTRW